MTSVANQSVDGRNGPLIRRAGSESLAAHRRIIAHYPDSVGGLLDRIQAKRMPVAVGRRRLPPNRELTAENGIREVAVVAPSGGEASFRHNRRTNR